MKKVEFDIFKRIIKYVFGPSGVSEIWN